MTLNDVFSAVVVAAIITLPAIIVVAFS